MRSACHSGYNVEFLVRFIDAVLIGNQSHRDSLIYVDNYIIISGSCDTVQTFLPILQIIVRRARVCALINAPEYYSS